MKTVVLAYHNIGCIGIRALLKHGYDITAVFTYKDDPNETVWFDSVAELAARHDIPVYVPDDINRAIHFLPVIVEVKAGAGGGIGAEFLHERLVAMMASP